MIGYIAALALLLAAQLVACTEPTQDSQQQITQPRLHPALAAWWRGLNADHNLIIQFPEFIDRLFEDHLLTREHPAFCITRRHYDTLAFTVPLSFFAYAKGFDVKRFVLANRWAATGGASAARVYALAFRIFLAGGGEQRDAYQVREMEAQTKHALTDAFIRLAPFNNHSRSVTSRFEAYKALFTKYFNPTTQRLRSLSTKNNNSWAEEQVLYAFEHFKKVVLRPEEDICKDTSPNNVKRALLFALHHAATGEVEDPCAMKDVKYPAWLYELTELLYGDLDFNQRLLIQEAEWQLRSEIDRHSAD